MSKTLGCWIRGGLYVVKYILPWSDSFAIFLKSRRKEKARGVVTFLSPLVVFSPDVGVDFLPLSVVVGGMLSDVGGWELVPYVSLHSSRQLCLSVSSDRSLFSPLTRLVNVFTHGFVVLFSYPICSC